MSQTCPLCCSPSIELYSCQKRKINKVQSVREYYQCKVCALVFLSPVYHLSSIEEEKRYLSHNNTIPWGTSDEKGHGYFKFLNQLWLPVKKELSLRKSSRPLLGLDYGSGPNPEMSHLVQRDGFLIESYDPYFKPDNELLKRTYDFVLVNEVVEHFNYPNQSWEQLCALIHSCGVLGVQTSWYPHQEAFQNWRYTFDETHVCFYQEEVFEWLAKKFHLKVVYRKPSSIVVFYRPE